MSLKLSALLLVFGICLCLGFTGHVAYANEYNSTSNFQVLAGNTYDSPKFDCRSDGECVMVVYNDDLDRLELVLSFDAFRTVNTTIIVTPSWTIDTTVRDAYPHVYDVKFINDSFYYITNRRTLYGFNSSTQALSTVCTISDVRNYFMGIYNSTYMLALNVSASDLHIRWNLLNGCNLTTEIPLGIYGDVDGTYGNPASVPDVSGFVSWLPTVTNASDIVADIAIKNPNGAGAVAIVPVSLGTFPSTYDGIWDYTNNKVYFRNDSYVATASTTDFVSWGTAQTVYTFGNIIEREDRKAFTGHDMILYENSTGIYVGDTFVQPVYTPATEYINGTAVYVPPYWWAWQKTYSPKADCEPNMQNCLMLVYDTGFLGISPAIWMIYSVDGFATPVSYPFPNSYTFSVSAIPNAVLSNEIADSNLNYYSLPYDVKYNPSNGFYYIIAPKTSTGAVIYTWSLTTGLQIVADVANCFTGAYAQCSLKVIGMENRESSAPYMVVTNYGYFAGGNICAITEQWYWLYNGTYAGSELGSSTSCSGYCSGCYVDATGGFFDGSNNIKYFSGHSYGGVTSYPKFFIVDPNITSYFPSDYNGVQYHMEGSRLVYTRTAGAGVSMGQWFTATSNFVSYTTPVLYYAWDLSRQESIPRTDMASLITKRVYVYERNHQTDFGIYSYRESVFPIYLYARYQDPVTGQPDLPVTVSATLTCPNNYTSSGIGIDVVLHSKCDSAMSLVLYATGFNPSFGAITFDQIDGCTDAMFIRANYLPVSYTVNMTVRDQVTGQPIVGATIVIGSSTYVTGAGGKVPVTVQPVLNPAFVRYTDAGSCTEFLQVNGTARSFNVQVSATGYRTSSYPTFKFVDTQSSGGITYFTYKSGDALNLYMTTGADVTVHVYTFDGVPVEHNLVSVKSAGANKTYVLSEGVPVAVDTATEFPAIFRLVDNRASYTATFNLTQGVYSEAKTMTILNTSNYYSLSFTLPENSSYSCVSKSDCSASYCQGTFFYELNDCIGSQCIYAVKSCTLCDAEAGCYEQSSSTECFFDTDCIDTCADLGTLNEGICGSGNICLFHARDCTSGCQSVAEGEAYCKEAPTVVSCDQSTTVGMLSCMQVGLMSFIGSIYSPMFLIGLALFIMVIVITVLGLAFKGAQNVIR